MKENIINSVPLKIYRRLRWQSGQRPVYQANLKNQGREYADLCYSLEKAIYQHHPLSETLALAHQKDQLILSHIRAVCSDVLMRYQAPQPWTAPAEEADRTIWVFWWTGEESAPAIVKSCLKSIRSQSAGHSIVLIDQDNLQQYLQLPEHILRKHEEGIMGHAFFSDIVRHSLLSQYGGIWIDATIFLSQPLPAKLFSTDFYTAKSMDMNTIYYSHSRWTGFFLAGAKGFPLFSFVRDMLIEYWAHTDHIIDYLLMDYMFGLAYETIPQVRAALDALPDNNLLRGRLMNEINAPYSPELFEQLQTGETFLSKLSWRYGGPMPYTKDGHLTNYGHLLEL